MRLTSGLVFKRQFHAEKRINSTYAVPILEIGAAQVAFEEPHHLADVAQLAGEMT